MAIKEALMAFDNEFERALRQFQQQQNVLSGLGGLGMGAASSKSVNNGAGLAQIEKQKDEINLLLLLGDDDEA